MAATASSGWAVMDRGWEAVQKKTFTRWCNKHLKKVGKQLEDLTTDFEDGLNLIDLVQVLGEKPIGVRYNKNPKMRVQKVENVGLALKYMAEHGVKTVSIGGEDIVDKNQKLVLGMVWTIISKWAIEEISMEELNARDALLLWCQRMTKGYKDVSITNFSSSWNDGLAFCALIHHFRSQMFSYSDLSKADAEKNTELAFNAMEQLDIPVFLDVEDVAGNPKPDDKSVMTQVAELYHYFASEMKGETAAKRIQKVLALTRENDAMKSDYEERVRVLLQWVEEAQQYLTARDFDNTRDGIYQRSDEFKGWKRDVLPGQVSEKLELEGLFNSLQTKLKLNNRAPYVPPEGLSPAEVDAVWKVLDDSILSLGKDIGVEVSRQDRLYQLRQIFDSRYAFLSQWCAAKQEYLASDLASGDVALIEAQLASYGWFEDDLVVQKEALAKLNALGEQMINDGYIEAAAVEEMLAGLGGVFAEIDAAGEQRKAALDAGLVHEKKVVELKAQLARRVGNYNRWLVSALATANEPVYIRSDDHVVNETERFADLERDVAGHADRMGIVEGLVQELIALDVADPLSMAETTIEALVNLKEQLDAGVVDRKARLDAAIGQYQADAALIQQIAGLKTEVARKVQRYFNWLSQQISVAGEAVFVRSAEDAELEGTRYNDFIAEKDSHAGHMDVITDLIGQLTALNVEDPLSYSQRDLASIEGLMADLDAAAVAYLARLDQATNTYTADQGKIAGFEEAAKGFNSQVEAENEILNSLKGSLEEQKAKVEERIPIVNGYKGQLEPLHDMYNELEDLNISHFTEWTAMAVSAQYRQLDDFVHKQLGVIDGQLLEQTGSKVTAEQLELFQNNFQVFDRDKSNGLNPNELKSLLASIGEERDDEFCLKVMAEYSQSPGKAGRELTLDEFISFITKFLEDADSPSAIQDAFALCADGKPFVTEEDLRKLFSEDDVAYMLQNMRKSEEGDGYDYKTFTEELFSR